MLYWQTFKKKNFHIGKDNDGDLEIPDNDYVCPVLPFISYQLVLEINVDWSNVVLVTTSVNVFL